MSHHDALALLVASLCHDIDHPGNTNTFEINTMVRCRRELSSSTLDTALCRLTVRSNTTTFLSWRTTTLSQPSESCVRSEKIRSNHCRCLV